MAIKNLERFLAGCQQCTTQWWIITLDFPPINQNKNANAEPGDTKEVKLQNYQFQVNYSFPELNQN